MKPKRNECKQCGGSGWIETNPGSATEKWVLIRCEHCEPQVKIQREFCPICYGTGFRTTIGDPVEGADIVPCEFCEPGVCKYCGSTDGFDIHGERCFVCNPSRLPTISLWAILVAIVLTTLLLILY